MRFTQVYFYLNEICFVLRIVDFRIPEMNDPVRLTGPYKPSRNTIMILISGLCVIMNSAWYYGMYTQTPVVSESMRLFVSLLNV